jgi:two-component system, sensor histidine kinase and response regulator
MSDALPQSPLGDILIVDDVLDNLRLLSQILTEQGYKVRGANSGARALTAAQTQPPELILLDISMPVMDGFEVCRHLKADARTQAIPVLFLSAASEAEDKVKGLTLGAVDYITKPFSPEELLARVHTHLTLRRLQKSLHEKNALLVESAAQVQAGAEELRRLNAELEQRVEARTAELRQARDAAETANRAKSAFVAIMGHELRTPLNGIFLAADMLIEHARPPDVQKHLAGIVLTSGRRLLQMIEGVLEYAAAEHPVNLEPVDVALALSEEAIRFEPRAVQKGLTLTFTVAPELGRVRTDARELDRLLRRLLDNAIKFTPAGGRVTVVAEPLASWTFLSGERPALRITVTDTGAGLRPEDCERIFEPFVQLEASYLEHSEGSGLGLTLARRQAEALGGSLWAESAGVEHGSSFVLVLPAL